MLIVAFVEPVKLSEQDADEPPPASVQLSLVGETPAPLAFSVIVPVGVVVVPGEVSLTVTVQLLAWPMTTGLVQLIDVDVARLFTVAVPLAGPLAAWLVSPAYDVDAVIVPVVLPVKLTEQLADAPLPDRVQLPLDGETPAPAADSAMVPVGVLTVPGDVSLTVAVQLVAWPMTTGLVQLTAVDVARRFTP
jgi:hypothetical protein